MRLDIINGLRGWAVLGVILWHVPLLTAWTSNIPLGKGAGALNLHPVWEVGPVAVRPTAPLILTWPAVNLFFFLSGFVLYLPYATGQRSMAGPADAVAFYKTRARRLLPLFAVFVFVSMLFPKMWAGLYYNLLTTLTFAYPFIPGEFYSNVAAPLWSLAPEVYFSLLFPAVLVAIGRVGFVPTVAFGCAVALTTRFVAVALDVRENIYLDPVADSIFGRLDDFLLGMVGAELYRRKWFARSGIAAIGLAAAGLSLWAVGTYAWDAYTLVRPEGVPVVSPLARPFFNYAFNVAPLLLVLGLAHAGSPIRRIWSASAMQLLGMMCYSVYLWHWPARFATTDRDNGLYLDAESAIAFAVLTLGLSALSYRYIEFGHVRDGWKLFRPLPPLPPPDDAPSVEPPPEDNPSWPSPAGGDVPDPNGPSGSNVVAALAAS